jgi:hypothetical protein
VRVEVPYVDSMEVTARPPAGATGEGGGGDGVPDDGVVAAGLRGTPPEESGERFDVRTDVTLRSEGVLAPARPATVVATIDGVPVRDAAVTVAGDAVGRTDEEGRVGFTVPASAREDLQVVVERGEVRGEERLSLDDLRVRVTPSTPVALPGVGATATVTVGGRPVAGAPVTVDGRRVGETGPNGTLGFSLPVANAATVSTSGPARTATTTVGWLFARLGALLVVVVAVSGVGLGRLRRRGVDRAAVRDRLAALPAAVARVGGRLVESARTGAVLAGRALVRAGRLGTRLASGGVDRLRSALAERSLAGARRLLSVAVGGLLAAAVGALARPVRWLARLVDRRATDGDGGDESTPEAAGAVDEPDGRSVRALWRAFVATLGLDGVETMTPGEVARRAVERGLPAGPVERLTDAFRDVEYGGRDPSTRRERAATAYDRIDAETERDRRSGADGSDRG